ncbi:MAG TPA: VWA domain-containing protein [Gammaproteobacteria bacterium]|nr:VWA domain-containing protein [Gammaproteobacteria bacterium]
MEEQVGQLWDRLITRAASRRHPAAAVRLADVSRTAGVLFRALGGDGGLRVEATNATGHGARRSWLQRLAGSNRTVELPWRDDLALRLPAVIDCFRETALNRDLYLWLAALASQTGVPGAADWFVRSQQQTRQVLQRFPGMQARYRRLVEAHLASRPQPAALPHAEARQETAIRAALSQPGSRDQLPAARRAPQPVLLWLHPEPPVPVAGTDSGTPDSGGGEREAASRTLEDQRRRKARRVEMPESDRGLVTIRMENIFTWGEFATVDRGAEENDDLDQAAEAAESMDTFSVTREGRRVASRLRFDLDLPSESCDDRPVGSGIRLPEWDYRTQRLQPEHCRVQPLIAGDAAPCELPQRLRRTANRLRDHFRQLAPARVWLDAQPEGDEVDLDAYLGFCSERAAGQAVAADRLYRDLRSGLRDLACLLLADLSLSTDSWINDHARVIDVIRDSLMLFAESLAATGDRFAMYGFSSRRRDPVRFHQLKSFAEPYTDGVRGRIDVIRPGYYTRMGAAIRHASGLLAAQPASRRLLLLLTDGKPNDLDKYEGRYGIEDTRHALRQARELGLQPFCVTVDRKAGEYLPHLFGSGGYVVIHKPSQLPRELPLLYARLTA